MHRLVRSFLPLLLSVVIAMLASARAAVSSAGHSVRAATWLITATSGGNTVARMWQSARLAMSDGLALVQGAVSVVARRDACFIDV